MTTLWTQEQLEIATKMYLDGHTVFEIAKVLHRSRSSVIGKISRLGLKRENVKSINVQPARPKAAEQRLPLPIQPVITVPDSGPVPFLALREHHCRAVLDQRDARGGVLCCGVPKAAGSSWCPIHRGVYIQPEQSHGQAGHHDQPV
jgi:hypothetical protein